MMWCGHYRHEPKCLMCRAMASSPAFRERMVEQRRVGKRTGPIVPRKH